MSLQGKVAIVTGGAQGIGRAIAEALAEDGADIAVADLDPARSQDAVAAIQKLGRRALSVKVNVADWNDAKAMADQVMQEWGKIDILVNNAGITRDGLLLRMKEEDWNLVLQVNLNGTFHCTKAVLLPMTKQRYGRIVNIASIVGARVGPGGVALGGTPMASGVLVLVAGAVVALAAVVAVSAAMGEGGGSASAVSRVRTTNRKTATAMASAATRNSPTSPPTSAGDRSRSAAAGGAGGAPQPGELAQLDGT